jgi:chaperonin GroES
MTQTFKRTTGPKPAPITSLRPLGDKLIIKPSSREQVTEFGIFIPDTVGAERPHQGTVIAAGDGQYDADGRLVPMRVAVGDEVLFTKYAGTEFTIDDITHIIITERDVLAVVEQERSPVTEEPTKC